jgi:hypothetical protein
MFAASLHGCQTNHVIVTIYYPASYTDGFPCFFFVAEVAQHAELWSSEVKQRLNTTRKDSVCNK